MSRMYRPYKSQFEAAKELAAKQAIEKDNSNMKYSTENFPPIQGSAGGPTTREWGKSFATLAAEWKEADDSKKAEEAEVVPQTEREEFNLPTFNNVRRFIEVEEDTLPPIEKPVDEWTYVARRVYVKKKERSLEEKFPMPAEGGGPETVWADGPQEHETCWDERRH